MEMMLTARTVGAEEAAALELANQVLPAENFIEHVHHFCQEMLAVLVHATRQQTTDARHGWNGT